MMGFINRNLTRLWSLYSPPIVADLIMQDLELKALETIGIQLPFYFRYVDNIMAVSNNLIDFTLKTFKSFHERLQFTLEIEGDRINFLDLTIVNNNNMIEFDWYHKPTSSVFKGPRHNLMELEFRRNCLKF